MNRSLSKRLDQLEADAPVDDNDVVTLEEVVEIAPEPIYRYLIALNEPIERALASTSDTQKAKLLGYKQHPALENVVNSVFRDYFQNGGVIELANVQGWVLKWAWFRFMWAFAYQRQTTGAATLTDVSKTEAVRRLFGYDPPVVDACWFNYAEYVALWQSNGTRDMDELAMARLGGPELELLEATL